MTQPLRSSAPLSILVPLLFSEHAWHRPPPAAPSALPRDELDDGYATPAELRELASVPYRLGVYVFDGLDPRFYTSSELEAARAASRRQHLFRLRRLKTQDANDEIEGLRSCLGYYDHTLYTEYLAS